jgi:GntR family transcriptional regulator of arabinose operon
MKTKYINIKDYLNGLIRDGVDGGALPSEHELCEYMNASRVTVRRAIGELENDGLIRRQKGKGSFISKRKRHRGVLNLFMGIPEKIGRYIGETPVAGCIDSVINRDIALHIFNTRGDISETVERAARYGTHGVIGIQPSKPDYLVYEELRKRGYPVLLINRIIKNSHYSYVSTDYPGNGFSATEFLIEKGHRRILFAGVSKQLHYSQQLHEGYKHAMIKNGFGYSQELTYFFPDGLPLDSFFAEARGDFSARHKIFDFTALVVASGRIFEDVVLPALIKHDIKIPEDIEVVVHDRLSTDCPYKKYVHEMVQPDYEIGMRAVLELEKIARREKGKARVLISSDFITKPYNKPYNKIGGSYYVCVEE